MARRGEGLAGACRRWWQTTPSQWSVSDLADGVGVQSYADKKRLSTVIRDALRKGEIERVARGTYRSIARKEPAPATGRDRMWRILRMRRRVTADDLVELAGVARSYALEYMRALVKAEVVRASGGPGAPRIYELAQDPVKPPATDDNARKLRELRARRKSAMEALMRAMEALADARIALGEE